MLRDGARAYFQCTDCDLIFLDPAAHPSPLDEVLRYLEHDNRRDDPEYLRFLRRLGDPLCGAVPAGARGLDFGCGPVPLLAEWLTAQGRPTAWHDPLFHPADDVLRERYDFVACSEVVEHAHDPAALFLQLGALLRPNGTLGVMTRFHTAEVPFATWWYRRDPTHVCFYSTATMQWIAGRYGWSLAIPAANVALFTSG